MPDISHTVRNSLIDDERTLCLRDHDLVWSGSKGSGQTSLTDITDVSLLSYPSFGSRISQCTIRSRDGIKMKIRSHSYRGLNDFEDRSASYTPFVQELCIRTVSANPQARFHAGHSSIWYLYLIILILAVAIIALILIAGMAQAKLTSALPALLGLVILLPVIWTQLRRGRGREFDPNDPPPDLLGT
ncbi:MAG: hypothetical protein NWT00_06170 [Beijerinckiaceae bacterium]|jgi:hypothetical protein|nr:hypothetical protein [Beijerinckiaceae bacterium]